MSRVEDWPLNLITVIAAHRKLPFGWGVSDCMQLCMDGAEAITGIHPYPDTRPRDGTPRYKTQKGALGCLKRHGFDNIVEALAAKYPLVAVALAQRGDLAIVSMDGILASCICDGVMFVGKAPGRDGIVRVERSLIVQAFEVR